MKNMLESTYLIKNEKLQKKIKKMMRKEEMEEKNTEKEILRLTERLRHVRWLLLLLNHF